MDELLLIDKPSGMTSFDVIRALRREYAALGSRAPKMGHAGTLDPLASGLMLIGAGEGTKWLGEYLKLPKTYEAVVRLGESRTTGDLEGEVVTESEPCDISQGLITSTLEDMKGMLTLPVPRYSAIKQGGEALYKKARRGEEVAVPEKAMEVRGAQLHSVEQIETDRGRRLDAKITFDVESGTYIRSLAEELGRRLGVPTTLAALRRTQIGAFRVEDARSIRH
ncbi:tRNA pseudouridine(55) synthase TruB [Patescibacteria group bacterium]|nr:tRNA pseudouridine(55) synthase TruB [Patescibacteria group bacterium]